MQSTIKAITRLQNSKSGNPRFHITMEDGTKAATLSNAGWVYEIVPHAWEGKRCKYKVKEYKSGYRVFDSVEV